MKVFLVPHARAVPGHPDCVHNVNAAGIAAPLFG